MGTTAIHPPKTLMIPRIKDAMARPEVSGGFWGGAGGRGGGKECDAAGTASDAALLFSDITLRVYGVTGQLSRF